MNSIGTLPVRPHTGTGTGTRHPPFLPRNFNTGTFNVALLLTSQLEKTQEARRQAQQRHMAEEAALLADNAAHLEAERVAAAAKAEVLKAHAAQTRTENEERIRVRKEAVQRQRQADNDLMKNNIR